MKQILLILALVSVTAQAETVTTLSREEYWDFVEVLKNSKKFKSDSYKRDLYESTDRVIKINQFKHTITIWTREEWQDRQQQENEHLQQKQQMQQQRQQDIAQRFDL